MITPKDYGINIESLKDKMYNINRKKVVCHINVIFYYGRQKEMIMERSKVTNAGEISEFLKVDKPDKIRIEYFKGADATKYDTFKIYPYEPASESYQTHLQPQPQGLGEVEINNLVDQRLREQKRAEEFTRLHQEVSELSAELDEQKELVEELETENEQLKTELEGKKQIRYYAGMLGDILEGIGISKDKIRSPIASLMGVTDEEPKTKKTESTYEDKSGLVEDEPQLSEEEEKRMEVINLITEFLKVRDNETLKSVFTIFSEVESNPAMAQELVQFIQAKKQ